MALLRVLLFLPAVLSIPEDASFSESKTINVRYSGVDGNCGGEGMRPCGTLAYAIKIAPPGATIIIDAGNGNPKHSVCYTRKDGVDVLWTKPLRIVGVNGRPRIGCEEDKHEGIALLGPTNNTCYVELVNVDLEFGTLNFIDCTFVVKGVNFWEAGIRNLEMCQFANIHISDSVFRGKNYCRQNGSCDALQFTNISCSHINMTLNRVKFFQSQFIVDNYGFANIYATNLLVSNDPNMTRHLGGLHLSVSAFNSYVHIENSTFENQIAPMRVLSVINLYDAGIWVKAVVRKQDRGNASFAEAVIRNCKFINNERGMTVVGNFLNVRIESCLFRDNIAMQAGAGLLVLTDKNSHVYIQNCIFQNNVAGSFRNDYEIPEPEGTFIEVRNEVHLNSECCKGIITLVGKGGAIRVQKGKVFIKQTSFYNNTAKLLGGSVFVDIDGVLGVHESYFENTPFHQHSLQGDIIYSDASQMDIKQVKIIARSAQNGLSIMRHSGHHWSLDITNVWVECPTGYDLRTTNSSAYGVMEYGLRRSYKLDQLSYYCESCPRNKYSLDHGYLNYTMIFETFAYITLLINGSHPKPAFTGSHFHHEIECSECPYGGHCVQGITAVANFWGYPVNMPSTSRRVMKFQHCPKGYCCSTPECPQIDTCVNERHGPLCGRCKEGLSEALFSPSCIPNEQCGPTWLWPFGFGLGLLYSLFLMFQVDLKNFLFERPIVCASCVKKSMKKPYMMGNGSTPGNHAEDEDSKFINCSENHNGGQHTREDDNAEPSHQNQFKASDSGFIIILFYYFQDALLLNVKTVYVTSEHPTAVLVRSVLSGLFQFQLDLFEMVKEVCVIANTTPVPKLISKAFLVPYVILTFGSVYALYKWTNFIKHCLHQPPPARNGRTPQQHSKTFVSRLSSGFILALLFMFQKMSTTTFTLLNCVPIYDRQVLFIDGWVTCYQYWQYGVLAYALTCTVPFFIVLMVGPGFLVSAHISLLQFFLACMCPLPFLVVWFIRWLIKRRKSHQRSHAQSTPIDLSEGTRAVLQVLQGPFKLNSWSLCWAGILIGRRLILVLLSTFVNDILIRLLGMNLSCFLILLHHVHVQPYKDRRGNIAGTVSAAALVMLGTINLVRAGFEAAEYRPTGPNEYIMQVFAEVENALLLWIPLASLGLVALLFFVRLGTCCLKCPCKLDKLGEVEGVEAERSTPAR